MKSLLFTAILLIGMASYSLGQNIGFNDNGSDPNPSALVDVYSTTKGMLIPRVSLDSTLLATPVTTPATSLLVYNTATIHDVAPGYYYWNGARWVRLVAATDAVENLNVVTKSVNDTLLKTENMVIASGDITLTLPNVTSADNGLEITVKCHGTYMDVVTVVAYNVSTHIDESASSKLYKNWGRTYIAFNGDWVRKENIGRADNLFDVSEKSSWTTIEEMIEFLGEHMTGPSVVRIGGGEYNITATQTINLPFPLTIQGSSFGESIINCPSGETAFNVVSECYFKMLTFQAGASGGVGVSLSGTGTYHEIKDAIFNDFTKGVIISNDAELWLFETDFYNCSAAGVELDAGTANSIVFRVSECDFYNCAKGIHLKSAGPETEVSILNATFYNIGVGQSGIYYVPSTGSDNFRFTSMIIQNNSFNSVGSFASGFDFSRLDGRDAKVFLENNAGVPSERPHVHLNVLNNTSNTTITTAGTYYKAAILNTCQLVNTTKWDAASDTTNRIRYLPVNVRDGVVYVSGNISNRTGTNRTANITIIKNGISSSPKGITSVFCSVTNQSYPFSTVVYLDNLQRNDYLELWVTSSSNGDQIRIDDLNWYTDTH